MFKHNVLKGKIKVQDLDNLGEVEITLYHRIKNHVHMVSFRMSTKMWRSSSVVSIRCNHLNYKSILVIWLSTTLNTLYLVFWPQINYSPQASGTKRFILQMFLEKFCSPWKITMPLKFKDLCLTMTCLKKILVRLGSKKKMQRKCTIWTKYQKLGEKVLIWQGALTRNLLKQKIWIDISVQSCGRC